LRESVSRECRREAKEEKGEEETASICSLSESLVERLGAWEGEGDADGDSGGYEVDDNKIRGESPEPPVETVPKPWESDKGVPYFYRDGKWGPKDC